MCATCGCGTDEIRVTPAHGAEQHRHEHGHDHGHDHDHGHEPDGLRTHTLELEQKVLAKNDRLAAENRARMAARSITAINLMSSPGSGKTTLLERTITELSVPIFVVEGDQETLFDAERIRAAGARAVQVNTGAGCHLDSSMVGRALDELDPADDSLVVIENVGNLVCPAMFDLGEDRKVVVISVTEGDDKPLKYPHMFAAANLIVVNKLDLLPHVDFDPGRFAADARRLNPDVEIMIVSARTGENLAAWFAWLGDLVGPVPATPAAS
jgi:hydrogenase nickel incorporation protein HypB